MKLLSKLTTISGALLLLAVLVFGLIAAAWFGNGGRIAAVQTGSMQPLFSSGDALLVMPAKAYSSGDIIRYQSPDNPQLTISHRLTSVDQHGWLTTKGDALDKADQPIPPRLVRGRVVAILPGFGRLIDLLHRPVTLLAVIYIPALALLVSECWRLARELQAPYRSPGYRS
jgi:signal peptidase